MWPLLRDFRHESRHTADCASFLAFSGELAAANSPGGAAGTPDGVSTRPGASVCGHGARCFRPAGQERRGAGPRGGPSSCASGGSGGLPAAKRHLLIRNTEAFLRGKGSNNVLLYGDAGTGKSTSIQALVTEYADQGLRLIELYKEQYDLIPDIPAAGKGPPLPFFFCFWMFCPLRKTRPPINI